MESETADRPPSMREWKDLYDAAIAFKSAACWNWMWDSQLFGVLNPETEEIGYCCVMGELGEHFALGVYLGTDGLQGYLSLYAHDDLPEPMVALHAQKCLMASFENREDLQREDRQTINELGLRFRGRQAWPLFRSFRPGYHPWFVTAAEARFLTAALRQALDVCLRFRDDPSLLNPPNEKCHLVRVPRQKKDAAEWLDEWMEPAPLKAVDVVACALDEKRLERINRAITRRGGVWETDSFYAPQVVREHKSQRPYYPYMIFWVEADRGLVLSFHMIGADDPRAEFVEHFLDFVEGLGFLPEEIRLRSEELALLFLPVAFRLGIRLKRVEQLPALEPARDGLYAFMGM